MPFVNRFASPFAPPAGPFNLFRNHPVILASGAATAGVLLGAYVAVQLLGTPAKVDSTKVNVATAPPPVVSQPAPPIASQPAPAIAETNGSAPTAEPSKSDVASVDCGKQTWPNISHDCLKTSPRTIATTKSEQPAATPAESSKPQNARPIAVTSTPEAMTPLQQPTVTARTVGTTGSPPATAEATPAVAPAQPAAAERHPVVSEQPPPAAAKAQPKRVAKKTRRKPAKQEFNDDSFYANEDDGVRDTRRYDRSRHVVQRYERDDDDRDSNDGRRVIVIRRGGGGLFGGLFGGFGDGD